MTAGSIMEERKYEYWFWVLNFGFLFFRLLYIGLPQLAPQEAYYWNYSRHLALSYFDHPPLHAWLIWLATRVGTSEFTVRLFAPLCAFGTAYFCFLTGKLLFNVRVAFFFVLTLNAILIFNIGSVILTPDVPLLFFWTLSLYLFAKIVTEGKGKYWYPLGVCLGLSMLSKYTAVFIPIAIALFLLLSKEHRFWFGRKEPYFAVILSLLTFAPVIIWNAQNGWASFAFQTSRRAGELGGISLRDFFAYLGSQIGVISPLIYGVMVYALIRVAIKVFRKKEPTDLLFFSWSIPMILFFTLVSFKYWVKMNWPTPGYMPAILAGVAIILNQNQNKADTGKNSILQEQRKRALGLTSLVLGFIFVVLGYASPFLPLSLGKGEAVYGWKELALTVEAVRQKMERENPLIIGYEYKTASQLAFYLPERPEAFSNNLVGEKGLAYDFWANPGDYIGRNAIFIYDQRARYKTPENLTQFFEKVEKEQEFVLTKREKRVTTFHIYRCYNYQGVS
jgi:4-amino-4-deoxy-L-arabinose transferase-like glycosyltransferase